MSELLSLRGDELLDVVDRQGEPTGRILDKKTIHEQGLLHRDVHVWITNGSDLLQQQRTWDKAIMPGKYDISVGEHVGAGESFRAAAVRGTKEELGLELPARQFIPIGRLATSMTFPGWSNAHNIIGEHFAVVDPNLALDDLQLQETEVLDARWYPLAQLQIDIANHDLNAQLHAPQPFDLYHLGIARLYEIINQV